MTRGAWGNTLLDIAWKDIFTECLKIIFFILTLLAKLWFSACDFLNILGEMLGLKISPQQEVKGGSCIILSFWDTFFEVVFPDNVYFLQQKGDSHKFQATMMRRIQRKKGEISSCSKRKWWWWWYWRKKIRVTTLRAQSGLVGNKTTRNPFLDKLYSLWHRLTNFVEIIDNFIAKYPQSQMLSAGFWKSTEPFGYQCS